MLSAEGGPQLISAESAAAASVSAALDIPAPGRGHERRRVSATGWLVRADRDAIYRSFLVVADVIAAAGAVLISVASAQINGLSVAALATAPLIVIISKLVGTFDGGDLLMRKSTLDEAPALLQLATFFALAAWLIDGLLVAGPGSRRSLLILWLALFVLLVLFRTAARSLWRLVTPPERCLVIGDAATCDSIQAKFARVRSLHAVLVASAALGRSETPPRRETPSVGTEGLNELVSRLRVERIITTPGGVDEDDAIDVVRSATSLGLKVSMLPRVLEVVGPSVELDDVEGVPMLSVRALGLGRTSRFVKRVLDVVGSVFGLVVLAPLLAGIALAIRLDSGGPALFRQRRIGRDGSPFEMLKFRTMIQGAEEQKCELHHLNQAVGLFKIHDDPRITRVGRLLRRASLDELPQLVNVLRGEMSLVGPRPLIAEEDERVEGWRRRRLHLTPGMTGHWQVLGSARIPLDEMVRIDYLYVTNWSLWLDVKILLRTIPFVLRQRGL